MTPNFSRKELACPCCNRCEMDEYFLDTLERIRVECVFPLHVNSGFRCEKHNWELVGSSPTSQHLLGRAADIDISRLTAAQRHKLAEISFASGIRGFGVYETFFHLDVRDPPQSFWVMK